MVHVNGDVTTCCLDEKMANKLGNLCQQNINDIWNGEQINSWRIAQIEGRFADSGPLCERCNWKSAGAYPEKKAKAWLRRQRREKNN